MNKFMAIAAVILLFITTSCSTLMKGLTESLYEQRDVVLVEDGAPAFLLLIEGMIKSNPSDRGSLLAGIQIFSAYSSAFVKDPVRKKIFSDKTRDWALQLLRTYGTYRQFEKADDREKKEKIFKQFVSSLGKPDLDYIFWSSNAWIMWILANMDSMDAFIELPIAKALIDRVYQLDDEYYYGAPHLFYGVFYGAYPKDFGGNLEKAKEEFDKALKLSEGKLLMTRLYYAMFYLKPSNQKEEFRKTIQEVLDADLDAYPKTRLMNIIAQKEAREHMNLIDSYFYNIER